MRGYVYRLAAPSNMPVGHSHSGINSVAKKSSHHPGGGSPVLLPLASMPGPSHPTPFPSRAASLPPKLVRRKDMGLGGGRRGKRRTRCGTSPAGHEACPACCHGVARDSSHRRGIPRTGRGGTPPSYCPAARQGTRGTRTRTRARPSRRARLNGSLPACPLPPCHAPHT